MLRTTILANFYSVNLQHSSCKLVFSSRVENSVDTDQTALSEQKSADLDLQCFLKSIYSCSAGQGLTSDVIPFLFCIVLFD